MSKTKHKPDILAPAGSVEQLISAVNNGCDAVYLGLEGFNARMKAPNFSMENLHEWVDYCHLFGVKVFVALNTSIKNDEYYSSVRMLEKIYKSNADGVIVTDLSLLKLAGSLPKPFEVVASTQLNVHDKYGAQYVKNLGATTVVCSRECSFAEIEEIVSTGIKVECFLHGALCVCQSGQCLFSAMVGGNSGNRGLCAQPCRKRYFSNAENVSGYLLSARDTDSLTTAKRLAEIGVDTFKIEGRNRRAEYAGITSRIYKKLFENDFTPSEGDYVLLAEMYNRGMSANRYLFKDNSEIIYPCAQNHIGVVVGTVKGGGFISSTDIEKGDGLKIMDGECEVCGGLALESGNGYIRAEYSGRVTDGMIVRRTSSQKLLRDVSESSKKLDVELTFRAMVGEHAVLLARYDAVKVEVESEYVLDKAINRPISSAEIIRQLQKSGDTCFTITDIDLKIGEIFIAKSQLNALRREVLDRLAQEIIRKYNSQFDGRTNVSVVIPTVLEQESRNSCAVICRNIEQLTSAQNKADYLIYKPLIIDAESVNTAEQFNCYIDLPSFSDNGFIANLINDRRVGLLCHNVGHIQLARLLNLPYIAGSGLNVYNDYMLDILSDAETFVYSQELALNEISRFANKCGYTFVDGELTLMKLVHCPYKVAYGCNCANCKSDENLIYKDELGNEFSFVRRRDTRCTFELINGKKLSVASKLKQGGRFLLDFDSRILSHYQALNNGKSDDYTYTESYTKGRLYNKVN